MARGLGTQQVQGRGQSGGPVGQRPREANKFSELHVLKLLRLQLRNILLKMCKFYLNGDSFQKCTTVNVINGKNLFWQKLN